MVNADLTEQRQAEPWEMLAIQQRAATKDCLVSVHFHFSFNSARGGVHLSYMQIFSRCRLHRFGS